MDQTPTSSLDFEHAEERQVENHVIDRWHMEGVGVGDADQSVDLEYQANLSRFEILHCRGTEHQ
jgi:hypothetical protein